MLLKGISGSRGIAIGKIYIYKNEEIIVKKNKIEKDFVEEEISNFRAALALTISQLEAIKERARQNMGDKEAAIFEAHIQIANDPSLTDTIASKISTEYDNAVFATNETINMFAAMFSSMDDPYMRERGADILDIGDRLLRNLLGMPPRGLSHLTEEVVLVAQDLTPSDTASLDKNIVLGFVTEVGGPTSHAAIMARTLEIPAVMGIGDLSEIKNGTPIIVNGLTGEVILNPSDEEVQAATIKSSEFKAYQKDLKESVSLPSMTLDGHHIEVFGNIGKAKDAVKAVEMGAEGIGLFRTEFLYMENDTLPSEEIQRAAYQEAVEAFSGRTVIIRTMDIGGDKELKCLDLPKELNPFLGFRAIRICLEKETVFKEQLRAILRASAYGDIQIMYPMVATLDEVRQANELLAICKDELRQQGISFNENIKTGIMVEIPAVAVMAEKFAQEVDFFSIGTNDLCQYTLAVDRMNENISHLYQPLHPAVLMLIKNTIEGSHCHNKITGMCGEMAGDPLATMILIGLGLDEFSMSAASIPLVKKIIRSVTYEECQEIAKKALTLKTATEVAEYAKKVLDEKNIRI